MAGITKESDETWNIHVDIEEARRSYDTSTSNIDQIDFSLQQLSNLPEEAYIEPFVLGNEDENQGRINMSPWCSWLRRSPGLPSVEGSRRRSFSEPELKISRRQQDRPRALTVHTQATVMQQPQAEPNNEAIVTTMDNSNDPILVQESATTSSVENNHLLPSGQEQIARSRWVRINRNFQNFITVVALLFNLLLFTILMCWVVLTSAYVMSLDRPCDVPLKAYYWLVSLQLLLDVFRSEILRFLLRWDSSHEQPQPPARVIVYNVTYLVYALLVMKMGVTSVYMAGNTVDCKHTAPDIFKASKVFVSLSLAAWAVIFTGYLLPFTVVALFLTWNGYHPTHTNFPVFPTTNVSAPDSVDHLKIIREPEGNCCICLEDFTSSGVVVETLCYHKFHRSCCREWLRQAKTCPVCREPIVDTPNSENETASSQQRGQRAREATSTGIPIGPSGRPVVGMVHTIRRALTRLHEHRQDAGDPVVELRRR